MLADLVRACRRAPCAAPTVSATGFTLDRMTCDKPARPHAASTRQEPNQIANIDLALKRERKTMKLIAMIVGIMLGTCSIALAQSGAPSGRGSTTGDPAASSANPSAGTTGSNPSGSGTSTSGGKDDNGDQGRDKMPDSNMAVRPSPGKPDIPNPRGK